MKWANFLHIYQPADQEPDILEAIVAQCYRPIISHIASSKHVKLTLNVTGALLELFDKYGYKDLIDLLKKAGEEGKIEFTGSAKYHAFLPLLAGEDIYRQIKINNDTLAFYLGKAYKIGGFFPPEMAIDPKIIPIIESFGFKWIIMDEIAYNGKPDAVDFTKFYKIKGTKMNAVFRERRLSNLIVGAVVRSQETLREAMREEFKSSRYVITAMDGETFGHHRPGLEKMLFDIFDAPEFNLTTISELLKEKRETVLVEPVACTWASSADDIEKGIQFLSWRDPGNIIHGWQWELYHLARSHVEKLDTKNPLYDEIKNRMDIGMASDHFWWASAKPWWSIEMIEDGAFRLMDIVRTIPGIPETEVRKGLDLYERIVSTAFHWKRSGKIKMMMAEQRTITRIPFRERTLEAGGSEVGIYHAFIDMMKDLEKKATARQEYEKAILWRDAVDKFEKKQDIYDAVNAIDLVRLEIGNGEIEKILDRYTEPYKKIRGGQAEQRGN
jgi:hypothetical protein